MADITHLATKLAKDKGYSGEPPTAAGIKGFVCPRANAYGGREGIIPPGIAAQKGLVPRGMKQVSVADTAKTANAAREDAKTEAERYLEYYGGQASSQETDDTRLIPPTPSRPASLRLPADVPRHPAESVTAPIRDDGMFSEADPAEAADDTLDGFYDSLKGAGFGTEEGGRPAVRPRRPVAATPVVPGRTVGMDFGHEEPPALVESENGRIRSVTPVERPPRRAVSRVPENDLVWRGGDDADLHSPAYRRMAEELDQYKRTVDELYRTTDAQAAELQALRSRKTERTERPVRSSETVRVVLSADERKIKIGGKGWEARIMGAIHRSRTGDEIVLSISDPSYAAELIASIVPGRVAILSGAGRTDCAYRGNCVKIYGEADSPDFITLFRFTVSPDGG